MHAAAQGGVLYVKPAKAHALVKKPWYKVPLSALGWLLCALIWVAGREKYELSAVPPRAVLNAAILYGVPPAAGELRSVALLLCSSCMHVCQTLFEWCGRAMNHWATSALHVYPCSGFDSNQTIPTRSSLEARSGAPGQAAAKLSRHASVARGRGGQLRAEPASGPPIELFEAIPQRL